MKESFSNKPQTLEENKFFEGKNLYAYQKNKNAPQTLLPLVEQMHETIANGEYVI